MTVVEIILQGMVAGHCDLDILLDPFFLPVTPTRQLTIWYPGTESGNPHAGLMETLQDADDKAPWRLFYRTCLQDHPAHTIARLQRKFYPSEDV